MKTAQTSRDFRHGDDMTKPSASAAGPSSRFVRGPHAADRAAYSADLLSRRKRSLSVVRISVESRPSVAS